MKVIDLLNKIEKGEDVPKRISVVWTGARVHNLYQYNDYLKWYETLDRTTLMTICDSNDLYCEVEIIEEDKDIEKIKLTNGGLTFHCGKNNDVSITTFERTVVYKINELIDEVKRLKNREK